MKRTVIILSLIFALAIALSASIPTLAVNTGTTTISGTLSDHIDITAVTTGPIGITLTPEVATQSSEVQVSVKSNRGPWTLKVKEFDGGVDGYMNTSANAAHLKNYLKVGVGDPPSSWANLNSEQQITATGIRSTLGNPQIVEHIFFQQTAEYDDDPGTYSMNVVFTATIN